MSQGTVVFSMGSPVCQLSCVSAHLVLTSMSFSVIHSRDCLCCNHLIMNNAIGDLLSPSSLWGLIFKGGGVWFLPVVYSMLYWAQNLEGSPVEVKGKYCVAILMWSVRWKMEQCKVSFNAESKRLFTNNLIYVCLLITKALPYPLTEG